MTESIIMIIFTAHALVKLEQRNIRKELVLKTVKNPDYEFRSQSNRKIIYKKFSKRYFKVVFKKESKNIIIITQHWDKTFKP